MELVDCVPRAGDSDGYVVCACMEKRVVEVGLDF